MTISWELSFRDFVTGRELTTNGLVIAEGHTLAVEWSAGLTTDGLVIAKGHTLAAIIDTPKDDLAQPLLFNEDLLEVVFSRFHNGLQIDHRCLVAAKEAENDVR
ncbi:hypothetical protein G7Y79_00080g100560 [Physcia stellaris]|nr:hypothetical protein G7Y79_00080g100560 [Physcia stellaris]